MADNNTTPGVEDDDVGEVTPGYKPPALKSLKELQELDKDDESLEKYKKALLAGAEDDQIKAADEGGNNVLVKQLAIKVEGREDMKIDLTGDVTKLKEKPIVMKEGIAYRVEITFRVQREIVSGLRYFQASYRKGIRVDKSNFMVGSYGPSVKPHVYVTPVEEAPSGMLARGDYVVKSLFTDDDKNILLQWEWLFAVKKDWQ